ncbi:MAG: DUF1638 domain-containing protein [Spirochaetaceae bacterium]|nr:DUF1638 domain-containing protein [Spirochaetaceae bacterium]
MKLMKLKVISCRVMWREMSYFAALSPNDIDLQFLPWGLHGTPSLLNSELQKAIDSSASWPNDPIYGLYNGDCKPDAIVLGYGLCSNGTSGISAGETPLVIPRAHDCITCFLGSRERYRGYFDRKPGTYWYTPGWIENHLAPGKVRYETEYARYLEKYGEDNASYLMEAEQEWFHAYSNAAYTDLGLGNHEEYSAFTEECAEWLGWGYDEVKGDSRLIKALLSGEWNDDDFLTVRPGQRIAPSYDEQVLVVEEG